MGRLFSNDWNFGIAMKTLGYSRGFTLVEVMVVVAIIAAMIGLVVGAAGYASRKAAMARAQADIAKIAAAVEEFRATYGYVPTNSQPEKSVNLTSQLWVKPQQEGRAPLLVFKGWTAVTNYPIFDPWGNEYRYQHEPNRIVNGQRFYCTNNNFKFGYDIWSLGPDSQDPDDDITNWRKGE